MPLPSRGPVCTPGPGAGTEGDGSPPPLRRALSLLGRAQCRHHHPCAGRATARRGRQAASQPHSQISVSLSSPPPSPPAKDRGDAPHITIVPIPAI